MIGLSEIEAYFTGRVSRLHVSGEHLGNRFNVQWCPAGLRDRPTLVSPFRERSPGCPRSSELSFITVLERDGENGPAYQTRLLAVWREFADWLQDCLIYAAGKVN